MALFFQQDQLRGVGNLLWGDPSIRKLLAQKSRQPDTSDARAAIQMPLIAAGSPCLARVQAKVLHEGKKWILVVLFEGKKVNSATAATCSKQRLEIGPEIEDIATPCDHSTLCLFSFKVSVEGILDKVLKALVVIKASEGVDIS